MLREDARHRVWVPALSCVVFLLGLVSVTLMLQSIVISQSDISANYQLSRSIEQAAMLFNPSNLLLSLVAVTGAIICALQGFFYLFNKRQLDFYHALPLKRQTLFLIRWTNGILFYIIPALAFSVLSFFVLMAFSLLNTTMLLAVLTGFIHNLLIFFVVYHTAIFLCMLSGHILIALGLSGIFSIYMYMIVELVPTFIRVYYSTYANFSYGLGSYLGYLAPAYLIFKLINAASLQLYIYAAVFAFVLLVGSVVLYLHRPSEAAGKAIAFRPLVPVLQVLIVIPLSIYIGLAFGQLASGSKAFWSIFGLLLFAVLIHMVLNVIFTFDIHAAFRLWRELAFSVVISVLFMSVFAFNILKLDDQIPSMNSVEAIYLDLPVDNDLPYLNLQNGHYLGLTDYRESHAMVTGEDISKVYTLLDYRITQKEYAAATDISQTANLNLRFVKSNGHSEYRNFYISLTDDSLQALAAVYNTTTYKQGHYQIFDTSCDTVFDTFNVVDNTSNIIVRKTTGTNVFSAAETKELIDTLRTDLTAFTLEEKLSELPVGTVSLQNSNQLYTLDYRIYPSFTKTIAWLNEHGIDFDGWKEYTPVRMTLYINEGENDADTFDSDTSAYPDFLEGSEEYDSPYAASTSDDINAEYTITDLDTIRSIYPYLCSSSMVSSDSIDYSFGKLTYHTATITFHDSDTDETYDVSFIISSDCDLTKYEK